MGRLEKLYEHYEWIQKIADSVSIEILKTKDMLAEVHDGFFEVHDLSVTKFNVLVILYKGREEDEELYMSMISDRMLLSNANITGLVDRMEEQGLVERVRSSKDRRKIVVKITEKGENTVEDLIEDYREWSKKLKGILSLRETEELLHNLNKLQQGIIKLNK